MASVLNIASSQICFDRTYGRRADHQLAVNELDVHAERDRQHAEDRGDGRKVSLNLIGHKGLDTLSHTATWATGASGSAPKQTGLSAASQRAGRGPERYLTFSTKFGRAKRRAFLGTAFDGTETDAAVAAHVAADSAYYTQVGDETSLPLFRTSPIFCRLTGQILSAASSA
jgi:hypothetical protein